ncbi:MAG: phosphoribosylaminoimidazolesuccinocarboxamide synthase [Candidatus Niyogibacteria bacterium]|nr:phosphoribosylaminoimidazolesuccinocarboxamide synthase [Candidatus Niyogibacteria bacterium]
MDVRMGEVIAEGKTKIIRSIRQRPDLVLVESKNDITAGDGKKHDVMEGKAEWSTATTCNVFRLLKRAGIPVAFVDRLDKTHFYARRCEMLPYEVVVRREAHGSYLKRHPDVAKGFRFSELEVEFFLKTTEKRWGDYKLPKDDPLIVFSAYGSAMLFPPDVPISSQQPFLAGTLPYSNKRDYIEFIARQTFLILEKAWDALGFRLADFKEEFGIDVETGELLLADVIDNDSWRLLKGDRYFDKQNYRDGALLDAVKADYARVAELSAQLGCDS